MYKDPFRGGDNILVMCDTYKPPTPADAGHDIKLEALPTNTRHACNIVMEKAKAEVPWFGIEQVQTSRILLCRST
jgi:glutamine synthetase